MILTSQSGKELLVSGLSSCSVPLCLIFSYLACRAFTHTLLNAVKQGQLKANLVSLNVNLVLPGFHVT